MLNYSGFWRGMTKGEVDRLEAFGRAADEARLLRDPLAVLERIEELARAIPDDVMAAEVRLADIFALAHRALDEAGSHSHKAV